VGSGFPKKIMLNKRLAGSALCVTHLTVRFRGGAHDGLKFTAIGEAP
jgi:hypothetical protein